MSEQERRRRQEQLAMKVELASDPSQAAEWAATEALRARHIEEEQARSNLAWSEAERVKQLRPAQRRQLERLAIWCESGKCCLGRVYELRAGRLLASDGESDARILQRSRPGADRWMQNATRWIDDSDAAGRAIPVTCKCRHTVERKLSVDAIRDALDHGLRNVGESAVVARAT